MGGLRQGNARHAREVADKAEEFAEADLRPATVVPSCARARAGGCASAPANWAKTLRPKVRNLREGPAHLCLALAKMSFVPSPTKRGLSWQERLLTRSCTSSRR